MPSFDQAFTQLNDTGKDHHYTGQTADKDFLKCIDEMSLSLATSFSKNNRTLTGELLTQAVNCTIIRLVSLHLLENKLAEPTRINGFGNRTTSWKDFITCCNDLETKYNGILFQKHFIDEPAFAGPDDIYFKNCCNEFKRFKAISIHVLGSIYEQSLGKIFYTTGKGIVTKDKSSVRKSGGIYYTPGYIVDYIIENTIGKLIRHKKPAEVATMKFADIACGCGSFLIGALKYLLDYHTRYYNNHTAEAIKDGCSLIDGKFILSLQQKKEILLNNIYGIDIDENAIAITRLSLYLEIPEDETTHISQKTLQELCNNIKCGNALIETGILANNPGIEKKIKPFDFKFEFSQIIKEGGFDAIIGNPPYVTEIFTDHEAGYFKQVYQSGITGKPNLYRLFILRACQLLKNDGVLGYIIPASWLASRDSIKFRHFLLSNTHINEILFFPEKLRVFREAIQACTILIASLKQEFSQSPNKVKVVYPVIQTADLNINEHNIFNQPLFEETRNNIFLISKSETIISSVLNIIKKSLRFEHYIDVYQGEINVSTNKDLIETEKKNDHYKPLIRGNNIGRYFIDLSFTDAKGSWLNTRGSQFRDHLKNERIVTQEVSNMQQERRLNGMPLPAGIYAGHTANYLVLKDRQLSKEFFIGLLNSSFLDFIFQCFNSTNHIPAGEIKRLPIPVIDFNNQQQKLIYDSIVTSVAQLLDGKKQIQTLRLSAEIEYLERKCASLERQVDKLVCELYGIPEDEMEIFENKS